jgi:phosphoadenosine phosphosulfate reductase
MRGLSTAPELESATAEEILSYAVERFHPRLALASSFQKESSVLLDMLLRIEPSARVFTIDTGVLFPETHDVWRAVEERYDVRVEVYDAVLPDGQAWTAERCCADRKVAALERALVGLEAWVSGLRREQGPTRTDVAKLDWDGAHGLYKANPLADWTEADVWRYISEHDVPYNPLHDRNYGSIGCLPCTVPGSGREGRWPGQDRTECGLHDTA